MSGFGIKNMSSGFCNAKKQPMRNHENILVFYYKQSTYNPQFQDYADSVKLRFKDGQKVNRDKQNIVPTTKVYGNFDYNNHFEEYPISFERGKYPSSVQQIKCVPNCNSIRLHPTQKPVELFEYLIKTYTNEGDLVLDNCAGSFTTAIACENLKRNWICIEKEEKYCEIGKKRLEEYREQLTLF